MIKLKIYNALEGDAFLLTLVDDVERNIIIDMGLSDTYESEIKSDLIKLNSCGKKIDLLVITHVDNDHIEGAISFIQENKDTNEIIPVDEIWHNSYRHLQFDKIKKVEISKEERTSLTEVIKQNSNPKIKNGISDVGFKEGSTFASLLYKYNYNWNSSFQEKAVCLENTYNPKADNFNILLLSPDKKK